ncbi:MAG: helix-turn-helix transcriptional regulator [Candidatus Limnocylindria bacterium]
MTRAIPDLVLEEMEPVSAGVAAGLAVSNRAPVVAVAMEFGRAGSGWAGAILFNLWLRRQLRERRMSQRRLAVLSGVNHSTISRLLQYDRHPTLETATKLAMALRKSGGELDTADYFDRLPEETLFPARRVEMALRGDDLLDESDVQRLMRSYLRARQSRGAFPARLVAGVARSSDAERRR